jgi:hypothetical protein
MTQRLKRWESPRRQGRNDKGKGGSARARQLKKQTQMLRKQLKESDKADDQNKQKKNQNKQKGRDTSSLPLFFCMSSRVNAYQSFKLREWIQSECSSLTKVLGWDKTSRINHPNDSS